MTVFNKKSKLTLPVSSVLIAVSVVERFEESVPSAAEDYGFDPQYTSKTANVTLTPCFVILFVLNCYILN